MRQVRAGKQRVLMTAVLLALAALGAPAKARELVGVEEQTAPQTEAESWIGEEAGTEYQPETILPQTGETQMESAGTETETESSEGGAQEAPQEPQSEAVETEMPQGGETETWEAPAESVETAGPEPGESAPPENASSPETQAEDDRTVLVDADRDAEAFLYAPEGESFPEQTVFRLLSVEDVAGEAENKDEMCRELERMLKSAWAPSLEKYIAEDGLQEEYGDEARPESRIRAFFPYYFLTTDQSGAEFLPSGEMEVHLIIRNEAFYEELKTRTDRYLVAWHGKGDAFEEIEDREIFINEEEHLVQIRFRTKKLGWFSVVQMDTQKAEEDMDGLPEDGIMLLAADLPSSGNNVTDPGSGFVMMTPEQIDGTYRSVRWYDGVSSFTRFNDAGGSVREIQVNTQYIFYPTDNSAKGKFGIIWHKVLYSDGQWYDLKLTVTDYSDYTYAGETGDRMASFPPIGFGTNGILFGFKPALGEYIMKAEYIKNGDGSQRPVRLNTRFQWWEIDNYQRFGLRTGDGSISAKYYQVNPSNVHCTTQPAEIDPGNQYLFVTAGGEVSMQKEGNVGFALTGCSTYYMVIGFRDHLRDDTAYRYGEKRVQGWNDALKNGTMPSGLGGLRQSDLDVRIPMDDAYPRKFVSNDASSWDAANTLPSVDSEFYYRIRQYVPWQGTGNYFSSFVIKDTLPDGADYAGGASVLRVEDQRDITGEFTVNADQDTVTVTASDSLLNDPDFYGYTYDIVFKARLDPSEMDVSYSANTASYRVSNTASVQAVFKGDSEAYQSRSNEVVTDVSISRADLPAPVKGVDGDESVREKEMDSADDAVTFSVFQTVPACDKVWTPNRITMTDTLEDCLEYLSVQVYEKKQDGYAVSDGWTAGASGQTVTASREFRPGETTFRFDITCRIKKGCDMNAYSRTEGSRIWYVIPNTAEVEVGWEHGSPKSVKNPTNQAQVRCSGGPVKAKLSLTKEIDGPDIVWAHGNPTFTFKITGEDVDGVRHTYYRMVEFTPSNAGGAKASLTEELEVPAGWYTVTEEKTMRYALESIHSVKGGSVTGGTAAFDLSAGGEASAVFYNRKTTDEGLTHSASAVNVIGE